MIGGRVRKAGGGKDGSGVEEGAGVGADGKRGELERARVRTADRSLIGDGEFDRARDRDGGGIIHSRRPSRRRRHSIFGLRK